MLCSVLNFFQRTEELIEAQRNCEWSATVRCIDSHEKVVGVMGVGEMGQATAEALSNAGVDVIGWRLGSKAPAARGNPGFTKVCSVSVAQRAVQEPCLALLFEHTYNVFGKKKPCTRSESALRDRGCFDFYVSHHVTIFVFEKAESRCCHVVPSHS